MNEIHAYQIGIIVIVILFLVYRSSVYHSLITGLWEADGEFCEEAGISYFYMLLGGADMFGERTCYILSGQEDAVLINKPTRVNISFDWTSGIISDQHFSAFFYDVKDLKGVFPEYQNIRFYPECGKMVLYYGDTITAVLYKNCSSSELVLRDT